MPNSTPWPSSRKRSSDERAVTVRLSRLARADLEDIRAYTVQVCARAQWLGYYRKLAQAFEQVSANPQAGRDRSLFVAGMRSFNCERHVIFYKPIAAAQGAPVILRIVHQRRYLPALRYADDLDAPG